MNSVHIIICWVWAGEWCGETLSGSLSLARKSTRKDRARRGLKSVMTKWDLKSHDRGGSPD